MQDRRKLLYLNAVVLCLVYCLLGCGSNDIKKAQEFMSAGMYPQAMELLNKRIGEKPSDPDAHFLMGICNIHTNNDRAANDRFASAVRLKPEYGFKIGTEYKKAGNAALTNGDMAHALGLYIKAAHYQPSLKDEIGTELLTEGKSLFEKEQHTKANARFIAANGIKPELGTTIAEYYYQAGKKPDVPMELKTLCFDNAVKYNKKTEYVQAHADHHYELGKTAETTEAAIKELKIANKFGGKFKSKLKAKQQQFEHEKFMAVVKKYELERGKAKHVKVEKLGKFKLAASFVGSIRVYYLSLHNFIVNDNEGYKEKWLKSFSGRMKLNCHGTTNLHFGMHKKPTDIYFWLEEL